MRLWRVDKDEREAVAEGERFKLKEIQIFRLCVYVTCDFIN